MTYKKIDELLTTGAGTEGSLLIVKKIYDELVGVAEKARIGRELASIYFGPGDIPGSSVDVDLVTKDSMSVHLIAEGAAIPIRTEEQTSFNLKPKKYGVAPKITKEMMEDCKWPLLQKNIQRAGIELAENETLLIISDALDNASNTVSGGAAATIANFTRAMQYLEDADFEATDAFLGPEFLDDLRNIDTFVEADKLGSREMLETGFVGKIYGVRLHRVSGNLINTLYCYLIDKNWAFVMAEKRPITVENYDDVVHDMSGATITQRLAVRQLRADAIAKITTS